MSTAEGQLPVDVVLVTYNSAEIVLGAVQSIDAGAEILVVDNASSDSSVARLRETRAKVIGNVDNLGFGSACNIGASQGRREFVLFLNPDARLRPGALARLVEAARARPQCAAFNPRILKPDGQQWHRRKSRLLTPEKNKALRRPLTSDSEVEILSGAALFCRRDAFESAGGFDENIFLYCEDDDLAIRLRKAGHKLGYVHDAIVEHIGDASSAPSPAAEEFKAYHFMKATRYATRKHGRPFRQRFLVVQSAVNLGFAALTFNQAKRAKFRGYLKALLEADADLAVER